MLTATALAECVLEIIIVVQRKCELFLSSFIQNPVPYEHMSNAGKDIAHS